jgi:phage terminase large subunit
MNARKEHRIGVVAPDSLMKFYAFWDIGGTGLRADAKSIWIGQIIGKELRFIDYYESVGQELSHSINWMREKGYKESKCLQFLPHDGSTNDKVFDVSYESALRKAGYDVTVISNQGRGAAMQRIEAARRVWPQITMNERTCGGGIDALAWYHEKRDDKREIGLGPNHDWSSHAADAFGLACIVYEKRSNEVRRVNRRTERVTWMG